MKDLATLLLLFAGYFILRYGLRKDGFAVLEVKSAEPTSRVGVRWGDFYSNPEHRMWRIIARVRFGVLPPRATFVETYIGEGNDWFIERTGKSAGSDTAFGLRDIRDKLERERKFAEMTEK